MYFRKGESCGVKMRISGAFAPETGGATAANPVDRASGKGTRRRHVRPAYALAALWVVIGFALYAFQMVRLVSGLG
jgi:hypothetical protein